MKVGMLIFFVETRCHVSQTGLELSTENDLGKQRQEDQWLQVRPYLG